MLAYDKRSGHLATWGFTADPHNPDFRIEENFKLFLDPEFRDGSQNAPTLENARQWYIDYLASIYQSINRYFGERIPRWNNKYVEFLFSVPTTWKDPGMIEIMKHLIRSAGFGQNPQHKVDISLTEAEAAGASVAKGLYEKGDVFLVCDAGGGTTDVNILKVTSTEIGKTELEPLSHVEGVTIGSTLIDFRIEKFLRERLEIVRPYLGAEPNIVAHRMMKQGRFESFKCSYGEEQTMALDLPLQIPNIPFGKDFPQAGIVDSKIFITRAHLQHVFDEQIDAICKLIDEELKRLRTTHSNESVNYLVLSGGLGSSPYLRQKLKSRYERGGSGHANAERIEIKTAQKPQLAVVHGLVIDRVQTRRDPDGLVFPKRRCRTSYGIVVREVYDPARHIGEDVVRDPRDGQQWAERQIHWFIKQGQLVTVKDGVQHPFKRKLNLGQERTPWATQVVMSFLPANQLPRSLKKDGARAVCAVESILKSQDLKLKNRHWYNTKPRYYRAEFNVRVLILAASLRFEIMGKDGKFHAQLSR